MIDLDNPRWRVMSCFGESATLRKLLGTLMAPDTTEYTEILEGIYDKILHQFECCQATYAVVPYLVRISSRLPPAAFDRFLIIMGQIGTFFDLQRDDAPKDLVQEFLAALSSSEILCANRLSDPDDVLTSYYIAVSGVGLAGHRIGRLFIDNFLPNRRADTLALCPVCGVKTRFACFDNGLVPAPERKHYPPPPVINARMAPPHNSILTPRSFNPWLRLVSVMENEGPTSFGSKDFETSWEAGMSVARMGITAQMPASQVFCLIGCILALSSTSAMGRYFHANDIVSCGHCKHEFVFAERWFGLF